MIGQKDIGLCGNCIYHSLVQNKRGGDFHLCKYSKKDPMFPKYPKIPVIHCNGFVVNNDEQNIRANSRN